MKQILLVDDEPQTRKVIRLILEEEGYQVIEAENGLQDLRIFKTEHFSLVITDIIMPEKEGLETISGFKTIKPDLNIIAISGSDIYLKVARSM